MLARLQFGSDEGGSCGAILTYPISGMPWRRNIRKSYGFSIGAETAALLFAEVTRLRANYPLECLSEGDVWNDISEKGNGITRDRISLTLCYSVVIHGMNGEIEESYSIRETSAPFLTSDLYRLIENLVAAHERL